MRAVEDCPHAGGIKPFSVNLDIRSGRIVFANDLRSLVAVQTESVNDSAGKKRYTENAASQGLALIFVGNSCPSVVKVADGLEVGCRDEEDEETGTPSGAESKLGTIITDLWWYSAMDYDLFVRKCAEEKVSPEEFSHFVVDVEPGVYSFSDEQADTHEYDVAFSRIWKTDADAPHLIDIGSHEYASLEDSQFGKYFASRGRSEAEACDLAEQCLFTLGNGMRWVKGNLLDISGRRGDVAYSQDLRKYEGEMPTLAIPTFKVRERFATYPIDWNSGVPASVVPYDVDIYWLAFSIIATKSLIDARCVVLGSYKSTVDRMEQARSENLKIKTAMLRMMIEIAEKRGFIQSGRLYSAFNEIGSVIEMS